MVYKGYPMETNISFNHLLDASLRRFFLDALRVCLKHPPQAASLLRTVFHQSRAARRRAAWWKRGLHVPPIMICSVTNRCNLSCKGCYARILRPARGAELSGARLREILGEAEELGIRFLVIAGGEPFLRPDLLELTRAFPRLLFLVFSNGLLIQAKTVHELARQRNVVPVLSLEGYAEDTDLRRGNGVYSRLQALLPQLKRRGIFFSVSLTVTRGNLASVTEERFIRGLVQRGCRLFFFIEYSPIKEGTEGELEPCPFVPYSDVNLSSTSLREALRSDFLRAIRENGGQLRENHGGCTLWAQREWVRSLLPGREVR